jgi:hypothetical protein
VSVNIVCSSAGHAGRSAQPDWQAVLGVGDKQVAGMLCGACARLDPPDPKLVNRDAVMAAIAQAIVDMQAILDTAAIPAGTLTTAQLSNFVRTAQTQINSVALRVKQIARLLNGDFTSST